MINFTDLYYEHIDGLFHFGSKFTADRELIKDCIQDVFVKLYTKRGELDSVANLKSYLYVSLRNRINDEFRRNAHCFDEEINENALIGVEENEHDNDAAKDNVNYSHAIDGFVSRLSPRQRQIVTLYYIEHRKYDEICSIMGINYQSVRNLMYRSLLKLRTLAVSAV